MMSIIASLAAPHDCLLAVVMGIAQELGDNDKRYASLIALAAEFRVPVISLLVDPSSAQRCITPGLALIRLTSTMADPLADESVHQAVNEYNRRKLILAGIASEGAVTFTALSALARGFDVFVVEDLCQSISRRVHRVAMQRLAQAGAVLTTALQLRTEWVASSEQLAMAQMPVMSH